MPESIEFSADIGSIHGAALDQAQWATAMAKLLDLNAGMLGCT